MKNQIHTGIAIFVMFLGLAGAGLTTCRWFVNQLNERYCLGRGQRMKRLTKHLSLVLVLLAVATSAAAQQEAALLTGAELTRVVPSGFYFQGLSAPTQMRNAAAARFGTDRYVITGLVDTSGYSADVRAKYVGFLITDSAITLNGESLPSGAYGFGFGTAGKLTVMDLAGKDLLSVSVTNDKALRRPRPLMMTADPGGVRLYNGRDYVIIAAP
jgi:hypothetical protein